MAYAATYNVANPNGCYTMTGPVRPTYQQALLAVQPALQGYRLQGVDTFGVVVQQVKTAGWRA